MGACLILVGLHLTIGGVYPIPLGEVARALMGQSGEGQGGFVIWDLRLPRALSDLALGAILAVAGASFQMLFRNPLAEPYIVGVSSGAAAGGTLAIVLGTSIGGILAGSTLGGLASLALVFLLARSLRMNRSTESLLLVGVSLGAMLSGLSTLFLLLGGHDTNKVLRWLFGNTSNAQWTSVGVLALAGALLLAVLLRFAKPLNALSLGEEGARRLGVQTGPLSIWVLATSTLAVSLTVGYFGMIGFVGLVSGHMARHQFGADLRRSLVGSAWIGATLLLAADLLAQRLLPGSDLPVGAITAVLGAPCLIWMIRRPSH